MSYFCQAFRTNFHCPLHNCKSYFVTIPNGFRRAGIGAIIVKYCIDLATVLSKSVVGCRFVTLVTKEGYRVKFYEKKCHFERVKASYLEPDCVLMRFNLYA